MLLGIDLGSTSIKAVLYNTSGDVAARSSVPTQRFHPDREHPEWTVWDPDALRRDVSGVCREVVRSINDAGSIQGIAVTGFGMDGLPMSEDGTALYPLISWLDNRTVPQCEWWTKNIGAEKTYQIGGNPIWAINSACRMLWLKEHERYIFADTYKWLLIEDFINHFLTGRFATDYSMASCTMLFDQQTHTWSKELCEMADIPIEILPEVLPSSTFLGGVTKAAAAATGLKEGTPVYLGGHDHLCSALPVGAFREGSVMNITGTWETIGLVSKTPPLLANLGESGIMTQSFVLGDRYMIWGGNPAGEMVEWYRRELAGGIDPQTEGGSSSLTSPVNWDTLTGSASIPPGSNDVMFLPHLSGCQCPWVDPQSRGAFIGLNAQTSHKELFRSVIEGLSYQILTVLRAMEAGNKMKASELVAVGGAIRNQFWMQNKADVTGLPVRVPEIEEATVLGAAILAGIGAGMYQDAEDAFEQVCKESETFKPNEKLTEFYQERLPLFYGLYEAVAPLHRQLRSRSGA